MTDEKCIDSRAWILLDRLVRVRIYDGIAF